MANALSRKRHVFAMATINFRSKDQILQHLEHDEFYIEISLALIKDPQDSKYSEFNLEDRFVRYHNKIYVPNNFEFRRMIQEESHSTSYLGHSGVTKMLSDVKPLYFWKGMKREITKFVAGCLECQRVKAKHR